MKQSISKTGIVTLSLLFLGSLLFATTASATGPRVTKALFAIDKDQVHALEFPPFLSTEVADGGLFSEIVNSALEQAGVDAVITTHPVQRMVKYYLLQENALAVMGRHLNFSSEARKSLILIPVAVMTENFYYYKPAYPNGLEWSGNLTSLQGKTYGAHKGEDVAAFKAAGIAVKEGRTIALLKMIAKGEADFAAIPALTTSWLLDKYMASEKGDFAAMQRPAGTDVMYVVFNGKHPQGADDAAKFRKALTAMVNDGSYAAIMKKHIGNGEMLKLYMGNLKGELAK
ncbi:amino acid ABC transporter substrate-binding protein, PAAT family [Mariprofundus aestuarium]|uniref:Amino acid ABC transporter substrate-binding protein, PAAT family n=1 Tax=Mariprofundus aestuarium TaxID=1921086 RepID=A0A2K8KXB6_MARES|nr:hypothetical protein [Mariprofundus aestuarium]ATX79503.1 amino acid ABC transporter substrate-binding protein, PAAT family [Mariprofundus aestuarium]